ncbi:MAG: septum formation protein Maf, partial [Bacteroidota bacterium]
MQHLLDKKFILASGSPRRKQLLESLGLNFTIVVTDVEESTPAHMQREEIPLFLSHKKASSVPDYLVRDSVVIAADTIVCIDERVLNKPENKTEAVNMLETLSGRTHQVYTGVTLRDETKLKSFYS